MTGVASLAHAEPGSLAMIKGIGERRAASLQKEALLLLAVGDPVTATGTSDETSEPEKRAKKLRKQAKQLRKQASLLTKKAKSTQSKKKRKRRLREAAELKEAAKKARRQAKRLLNS